MQAHGFAGNVVPFTTSGGSGMGDSAKNLQALVLQSEVKAEKLFKSAVTDAELTTWIKSWL